LACYEPRANKEMARLQLVVRAGGRLLPAARPAPAEAAIKAREPRCGAAWREWVMGHGKRTAHPDRTRPAAAEQRRYHETRLRKVWPRSGGPAMPANGTNDAGEHHFGPVAKSTVGLAGTHRASASG
jgi:hypothetical protein